MTSKNKRKVDKNKKRVLVCLSGGVDSSVTALLLLQQGYDVTGAFMVNYDDSKNKEQRIKSKIDIECWRKDYRDATRVAAHLGIPLVRWDFTVEYARDVLAYMDAEYKAGRTPNPDVLCNEFVKFGAWLERAKKEGFDYIATGHYASVSHNMIHVTRNKPKKQLLRDMCYMLRESKDTEKDQTYFLHRLSQDQLKHTLFPLGSYTKTQVRALAKKHNLPTAQKEESMGICFIGEVPMKDFLQSRISQKPGDVVLADGTKVGKHDGLAYYTIGQRHGVVLSSRPKRSEGEGSLSTGKKKVRGQKSDSSIPSAIADSTRNDNIEPLYVLGKDKQNNTLVIGPEEFLYKKEVALENIHWITGREPQFPIQCEVRLRHRQPLQKATLRHCEERGDVATCPQCLATHGRRVHGQLIATFRTLQRAPTPGQFMVLYKNGVCLGGGVIS